MTIALAADSYQTAEKLAASAGHSNVSDYIESLIEEAETLAAIREGLADVDAGRVRPVRAVFAEIAASHGLVTDETSGPDAALERAERVAKLRRSMADFEAGRYRPAKDVLREIAAEDGIILPE